MIKYIFKTSDYITRIEPVHRNPSSVMLHLMEEVGELSTEVSIDAGTSYKKAGPDGIVGEAMDTIIDALDVIRLAYPFITEQALTEIAMKKCDKWILKVSKDLNNKNRVE